MDCVKDGSKINTARKIIEIKTDINRSDPHALTIYILIVYDKTHSMAQILSYPRVCPTHFTSYTFYVPDLGYTGVIPEPLHFTKGPKSQKPFRSTP